MTVGNSSGITREDWLAAVAACEEHPTDDSEALTSDELEEVFGCGATTVRKRLRALFAEDRVTRATKIIKTESGRLVRVPAYRLVRL
jgi:hypothetical protein